MSLEYWHAYGHTECEAFDTDADTLLGISLYGTDSETIITWLDINIIRNRKLKPCNEIEHPDHYYFSLLLLSKL